MTFRSWRIGSSYRLPFLFRIGFYDQRVTRRLTRWYRNLEGILGWAMLFSVLGALASMKGY